MALEIPKKKRKRPEAHLIEEAVSQVIDKGQSINKTALTFNVSRAYLARIVKKAKSANKSSYKHNPNIGNKRIFSSEQETLLANYLKFASIMGNGHTRQETKKLAFDYAVTISVCPNKWKDSQSASDDWLKGFTSRHKELAFRKPESTSHSKKISFMERNVSTFYDKITNAFTRFNFPHHTIFDTNEICHSTITDPLKVIKTETNCTSDSNE